MKKSPVGKLAVIALVLMLVIAGELGFVWFQNNHVFVDEVLYPTYLPRMDLREKEIGPAHYTQLQQLLPECEILWNVPFQDSVYPSNIQKIRVRELSEEDVLCLNRYFPQLKTVDAMECRDYPQLQQLQQGNPGLEVLYQVDLGGSTQKPETEQLELNAQDYILEQLIENLAYLPKLQSLLLRTPDMSQAQIRQIRETYPQVDISCTVAVFGKEYPEDTAVLEIPHITQDQVPELLEKLSWFPGLQKLDLNGEEVISATEPAVVKAIQKAAPELVLDYQFSFHGKILSTLDEEIYLKNIPLGDAGETQLREMLDLVTGCKRIVLESCELSNQVLAKIREDYRGRTKVVWEVFFGKGSALTDAEVLRCTYDLWDSNCSDLIYCEDVRYLDIGHNTELDAVEFIAGMPKLEVLIMSASPVKDISPLQHCKKLRILEAAYCYNLEDLSPLRHCSSLELLNISYTRVGDLSPLEELPIKTLCAMHESYPSVRYPERERMKALKPEWEMNFFGANPYGHQWRYDNHYEKREWYAQVSEIFKYPDSPNNTGWYLQTSAPGEKKDK